jgi:hypothetical protein
VGLEKMIATHPVVASALTRIAASTKSVAVIAGSKKLSRDKGW